MFEYWLDLDLEYECYNLYKMSFQVIRYQLWLFQIFKISHFKFFVLQDFFEKLTKELIPDTFVLPM